MSAAKWISSVMTRSDYWLTVKPRLEMTPLCSGRSRCLSACYPVVFFTHSDLLKWMQPFAVQQPPKQTFRGTKFHLLPLFLLFCSLRAEFSDFIFQPSVAALQSLRLKQEVSDIRLVSHLFCLLFPLFSLISALQRAERSWEVAFSCGGSCELLGNELDCSDLIAALTNRVLVELNPFYGLMIWLSPKSNRQTQRALGDDTQPFIIPFIFIQYFH